MGHYFSEEGQWRESLHASAPVEYKCADCSIDIEPCPTCYSAWWQKRHPNVAMAAVGNTELNALRMRE
jgi:hypothetical protein